MTTISWVLIDNASGAKTADGSSLSPEVLVNIAAACQAQLEGEFANEYGGSYAVRAGSSPADIAAGERVFAFVPSFPDEPDASAYHVVDKQGVEAAYCAVTTCGSLFGPTGVSVDASHELCEAARNPGCNGFSDRGDGTLVANEVCDPVEVQTYPKLLADGTQVSVSNFVLKSWFDPGAPAPYDYMCSAGLPGGVAPPGPMKIAPGDGGNYEIVAPFDDSQEKQVFATLAGGIRLLGKPRKSNPTRSGLHEASRARRIARKCMRGKSPRREASDHYEEGYEAGYKHVRTLRRKLGSMIGAGFGAVLGEDFATGGANARALSSLMDNPLMKELGQVAIKFILERATRTSGSTEATPPAIPARCGAPCAGARGGHGSGCFECAKLAAPTDAWLTVDGVTHAFSPMRAT